MADGCAMPSAMSTGVERSTGDVSLWDAPEGRDVATISTTATTANATTRARTLSAPERLADMAKGRPHASALYRHGLVREGRNRRSSAPPGG